MITLDKERGVNPRLIYCNTCKKNVGIALMGNSDYIYQCNECRVRFFAGPKARKCKNCGSRDILFVRRLEEFEKLIVEYCDDCIKKSGGENG